MNVPPMPSAHLFANLGGPVRRWDSDPSVPSAEFIDGSFMGVSGNHLATQFKSHVGVTPKRMVPDRTAGPMPAD
jgi:hypothetical protein